MNKEKLRALLQDYRDSTLGEWKLRLLIEEQITSALAAAPQAPAAQAHWPMETQPDGSVTPVDPTDMPAAAQAEVKPTDEQIGIAFSKRGEPFEYDASDDDWQHLKPFGYAPGNYMSKCLGCGAVPIMDKRAWRCRPCAEAEYAAPAAQDKGEAA